MPISSKLAPIIARLKYGKRDNEPLVSEGFRVGDKFSRALRKLKLADVREGSRRSKINFHSWRRTAVMQLDRAGIPEIVSARLIGHKVRTLTYGVYNSAGASDAQLRAAVEVLELPA